MSDYLSPKKIMDSGLCIGCGSCVAQSEPADVKMDFDKYGQLKPTGSDSWIKTGPDNFNRLCPFSPEAFNEDELAEDLFASTENETSSLGYFQAAYVGYVAEENFRIQGSSGGMVTWAANELLRNDLIDGVAHVVASENPQKEGRFFRYRISRTEEEIREGAKSRYYPIELSEILKVIQEVPGRYAVVGIPCFIKAIQLLRREDPIFRERIKYTLGLFCGHMKSARFIESFAWQMGVPVSEIQRVEYRHKDPERPANWYNARLILRNGEAVNKDWWHLADGDWGAGFFMNSACNYCDDVVAETADISFGDAWVEPYASDGKGTNVVVVRSKEVQSLVEQAIDDGRLQLETVNNKFVEETQAAGFRQRRDGLAYRLTWNHKGVKPKKRVLPDRYNNNLRRKIIYRIRFEISAWSHRISKVASLLKMPQLYIRWARMAMSTYHGFAYYRGKFGTLVRRLGFK